jgi:hypothetical protein
MRQFLLVGFCAVAFSGLLTSGASAEDQATRGLYVDVGGGWNWQSNIYGSHERQPDHPIVPNLELPGEGHYDDGWAVAARLG